MYIFYKLAKYKFSKRSEFLFILEKISIFEFNSLQ